MNGEDLKKKIAGTGLSVSELARILGMSQQNLSKMLSSQDIKTGLVERISVALKVPITYFFDSSPTPSAVANGDYSAASVNGNASVEAIGEAVLKERIKALEQLLDEKERTIQILINNQKLS